MHRDLYASSFALWGVQKSARLIMPSCFLAAVILASMFSEARRQFLVYLLSLLL